MIRGTVVTRKTVREFSSPVLLAMFFVPFVGLSYLIGSLVAGFLPDDVGTLPLRAQEQWLIEGFSQVSFAWAAGIPVMILVTVLAANGIAKEHEQGTLRILLSKPIRRTEVLFGKFLAIFLWTFLVMVAGLLLSASVVFSLSGASSAAIAGSIGHLMPGNLVYALFVSVVVAAVGTFFAVTTGSRIQTVLGVLLIPLLFFAFMFLRIAPTGDIYEDYALYLLDINYHFGNAFVFLHEAVGTEFTPSARTSLATTTGVYDAAGSGVDPLVGGIATSVPLAGHVAPVTSIVVLLVGSLALLGVAVYRFERADIS